MPHVTPGTAKPTIRFIHRNGANAWAVKLTCGHRITLLKAELARLQWFIGRPVDCPECCQESLGAVCPR